ncbi:MAG: sensor histidine kinase [Streptosporangiaceae bacterium]
MSRPGLGRWPVARPLRGLRRRTVRMRLTALYGSLFLASGTALLAVTYAMVESRPTVQIASLLTFRQLIQAQQALQRILGGQRAAIALRTLVAGQRTDTLHQFLLSACIALAMMTVASAWLGWLVAGRTLRPLRVMTGKARRISEQNLHERLALSGPQDELTDLSNTFDGLLARLEAAFSAQRQFVANASHELRTPLTLERAMVEVALADPDASAQSLRATCERVLAVGAQQERILDALLTLAHGQRGLERREPFSLHAIVGDVLAERQAAARHLGLRIETSLRPAPTAGDPALAERLAANLADNAFVHNASGGWVRVRTCVQDGRAVLLIANSGPVVAQSEVDRLLRPFERMGTDRTGRRLGLGLAIVAAIASAHEAALTVRPQPGGGLEIRVAFPLAAGSATVPPGRIAAGAPR